MKRRTHFHIAAAAFLSAVCAFAQFGPPAGAGGPTIANQVPRSGQTSETGSVAATQSPVAGTTNSVNTINPSIEVSGPYTGSETSRKPFNGKLSLRDAIARGLDYNLGTVGLTMAMRQAHGQSIVARSALLPNLHATLGETVEQIDLRADGLRFNFSFPGIAIPAIVGPFNYFDLRAHLTQTVADFVALNNYRSSKETLRANDFFGQDAKDLVVLAVGGAYLQVIAAQARVVSAKAQLDAANALYSQTTQQHAVGLVAQIDVNKNQVQALTQQQRLSTLQNDLAKQKINLARLTGLPPNENYEITDDVPFAEAPPLGEDEAVQQAFMQRADLKAAQTQVHAAERTVAAAKAERLPSVSLSADYGVIGTVPDQSHGTFSVSGTLSVPMWEGGRINGDIEQANAALSQRQAELEDTKSKVESDVRNAFLDLKAATSQVAVAQQNLDVTRQTLDLTRQRFDAGVTDAVDVSNQQAAVAAAELDYINAVFAHNVAKLSLARAIGDANQNLPRFLKLQ